METYEMLKMEIIVFDSRDVVTDSNDYDEGEG